MCVFLATGVDKSQLGFLQSPVFGKPVLNISKKETDQIVARFVVNTPLSSHQTFGAGVGKAAGNVGNSLSFLQLANTGVAGA